MQQDSPDLDMMQKYYEEPPARSIVLGRSPLRIEAGHPVASYRRRIVPHMLAAADREKHHMTSWLLKPSCDSSFCRLGSTKQPALVLRH